MDGGFLAVAMELHADFNDTCRVYYKTNWIKPCFMYVYTYSLYDVYIYISYGRGMFTVVQVRD